jgi:hypothetical protein
MDPHTANTSSKKTTAQTIMGITFDETSPADTGAVHDKTTTHDSPIESHLSSHGKVFDVSKAFENEDVEIGTIVSDRRRQHPTLGKNMHAALSEWWGKAKITVSEATDEVSHFIEEEKPLIQKAETRREVIKEAATFATMAPKDDHHMVVEKVRTFKQDAAKITGAPLIIKAPTEVVRGTWTHTQNATNKAEVISPVARVAAPDMRSSMIAPVIATHSTRDIREYLPETPQPKSSVPLRAPAPTQPAVEKIAHMHIPNMVVKKEVSVPSNPTHAPAPLVQPVKNQNITVTPVSNPTDVEHTTPTEPTVQHVPVVTPEREAVPPVLPIASIPPQTPPTPQIPIAPRTPPQEIVQPHISETPVQTAPVPAISFSVPTPTAPTISPVTPREHFVVQSSDAPLPTPVPTLVTTPRAVPPPRITGHAPTPPVQHAPVPTPAPLPSTEPVEEITSQEQITPPVTPESTSEINAAPISFSEILKLRKTVTPESAQKAAQTLKDEMREAMSHESVTPQNISQQVELPEKVELPIPPQAQPVLHTNPVVPQTENAPETTVPHTPPQEPILRPAPAPRPNIHGRPATPPTPLVSVVNSSAHTVPSHVEQPAPSSPRMSITPIGVPIQPLHSVTQSEFRNTPAVPRAEKRLRDYVDTTTDVPPTTSINPPTPPQQPIPPMRPPVPQNQSNTVRTFTQWGILAGVILLAITLGVVASIYFNVFKNNPTSVRETTAIPSLFKTDSQTALPLQGAKREFLTKLHSVITDAPSGLSQFYLVVPQDTGEHVVTSKEFFAFLSTHFDEKAIRSLDDTIMIGSITTTKNEPFIILRSYSFDTLFAGLLKWEPTMRSDLAPVFGDTSLPYTYFRDAVRNNASTRILFDENKNEILLYSFINKNTVVITTSGEALAKIIQQF